VIIQSPVPNKAKQDGLLYADILNPRKQPNSYEGLLFLPLLVFVTDALLRILSVPHRILRREDEPHNQKKKPKFNECIKSLFSILPSSRKVRVSRFLLTGEYDSSLYPENE